VPVTGSESDGAARPPVVSDRRARRVAERRDRVYGAAVELFIERGFDSTTMDEIAERADVARASVFNYYQRKVAFLDEWSARRRRRAFSAVDTGPHDDRDVRQVLVLYMIELARISESTRVETVAVMGAAIHSTDVLGDPPLARALAPIIIRAKLNGELRAGVDAEQAALLVATGYFATLAAWINADPAPFRLEAALLQMLELTFGGILNERNETRRASSSEPTVVGQGRAAAPAERIRLVE